MAHRHQYPSYHRRSVVSTYAADHHCSSQPFAPAAAFGAGTLMTPPPKKTLRLYASPPPPPAPVLGVREGAAALERLITRGFAPPPPPWLDIVDVTCGVVGTTRSPCS